MKKAPIIRDTPKLPPGVVFGGAARLQEEITGCRVGILENKGTLRFRALPVQGQFAPMYAVIVEDFNGEGKLDIMLGGN